MKLQMDPGEIVREYRAAANKTKHVRVLADLNACTGRDIAELLADQGEELTAYWQTVVAKPRGRGRGRPKAQPAAVITEAPAEPLPGQATFFDGEAEAALDALTEPTPTPAPEPEPRRELVLAKGDLITKADLFEAIAQALPQPEPEPAPRAWTVDQLKIIAFDVLESALLQREEYGTAVRVLHELIAQLEAAR